MGLLLYINLSSTAAIQDNTQTENNVSGATYVVFAKEYYQTQ